MNLCDDGHDEVCYGDRRCPVCEVIAERDELQVELATAKERAVKLEDQIEEHVCEAPA